MLSVRLKRRMILKIMNLKGELLCAVAYKGKNYAVIKIKNEVFVVDFEVQKNGDVIWRTVNECEAEEIKRLLLSTI